MADKKYVLDYHAAKLGCQIKWLIDKSQSKRLVPFVDYIRCDLDGENYTFLKASHGDFKEVAFAEFHEKQHKQGNVVSFYYTAWIILTPFIDPKVTWFHALFPARWWAFAIPTALLVVALTMIATFVGIVSLQGR